MREQDSVLCQSDVLRTRLPDFSKFAIRTLMPSAQSPCELVSELLREKITDVTVGIRGVKFEAFPD